ncbi:MAG: hypothetical protein K2W94_01435 [Alphaproteobacteria bacterium]|nr:hypothetical protein [Alphaproteobacteria bacterium]
MSSVPRHSVPIFSSLPEQVSAPNGVRYFSSASAPSLLDDPEIQTALGKISGNCLKEIAARGNNDFVDKSYKLVSLLKMCLKRGSSFGGQGGLLDVEDDWFAAWERQSEKTKTSLKAPHDEIEKMINIANEIFYDIKPK